MAGWRSLFPSTPSSPRSADFGWLLGPGSAAGRGTRGVSLYRLARPAAGPVRGDGASARLTSRPVTCRALTSPLWDGASGTADAAAAQICRNWSGGFAAIRAASGRGRPARLRRGPHPATAISWPARRRRRAHPAHPRRPRPPLAAAPARRLRARRRLVDGLVTTPVSAWPAPRTGPAGIIPPAAAGERDRPARRHPGLPAAAAARTRPHRHGQHDRGPLHPAVRRPAGCDQGRARRTRGRTAPGTCPGGCGSCSSSRPASTAAPPTRYPATPPLPWPPPGRMAAPCMRRRSPDARRHAAP